MDLDAVVAAMTGEAPWLRDEAVDDVVPDAGDVAAAATALPGDAGPVDLEALFAGADALDEEYAEAEAAGLVGPPVEMPVMAGRVAESLPPGPDLASWLTLAPVTELEDGALAGVAASFRRLASWASAGELTAVAQIASRSARADKAEVAPDGRPGNVTADAAGQVALALAMSPDGARAWAELGVTLSWRLAATGRALAAGEIDLPRARMIARMTAALDEEAARAVEAAVLGRAGWWSLGQLAAALRRAVIKADPNGAERRRQEAERRAMVALYPEDEGTATLAGYNLPGIDAAAAMARISALAKAMQAAGTRGRIDLVRAQVFLGLLLGTLPYIPPPADGVPPDGQPPPADEPPADEPPADESPADGPVADGKGAGGRGGGEQGDEPGSDPNTSAGLDARPDESWVRDEPEDLADIPDPPEDFAGVQDPSATDYLFTPDCDDDSIGPWPAVPAFLASGPGVGGPLNLTVPLTTLAGTTQSPGSLSRLGVVTAGQARQVAALAAQDPAAKWRIIVTTPAGQTIAVTHLPRSRAGPGPDPPTFRAGLTGQITLVVSTDDLCRDTESGPPGHDLADLKLADVLERAFTAAERAASQAAARAMADERAVGGCAHALASKAYRPPPRVSELVRARDGTCRHPTCRRPAALCDLDHVVPYHQGGLTCICNIGGECRRHHQLKQHPRWTLSEPAPGVFRWTTPTGRRYIAKPDPQPL
jgi:hypothetical protein